MGKKETAFQLSDSREGGGGMSLPVGSINSKPAHLNTPAPPPEWQSTCASSKRHAGRSKCLRKQAHKLLHVSLSSNGHKHFRFSFSLEVSCFAPKLVVMRDTQRKGTSAPTVCGKKEKGNSKEITRTHNSKHAPLLFSFRQPLLELLKERANQQTTASSEKASLYYHVFFFSSPLVLGAG